MDYFTLYREISGKLRQHGIVSFDAETGIILRHTAGNGVISAPDIPPETVDNIRKIVERRIKNEPLQYILQSASFREIDLYVTPAVLIPRPETELLAGYFIDTLAPGAKMLDIGTGSGAVALSAAYERNDLQVTAVDISPAALQVARKNALDLQLDVEILHSDLFSALPGRKFDGIAANLPYVTFAEYDTLAPEVRDFEPELALTAPEDGFALIGECISQLPEHLLPGGMAVFEMSPHQTSKAAWLLKKHGFAADILCDLTGRERFVRGICK